MLNIAEYKTSQDLLSDWLPWALLAAPGVVFGKDGHFQKTWTYRGSDLASSTPEELIAVSARVNNALLRLGQGYTLHVEARRELQSAYPESLWPDAISLAVDHERQRLFERGAHFESSYYLSLVWQPPSPRQDGWLSLFVSRERQGAKAPQEMAHVQEQTQRFLSACREFAGVLSGVFPEFVELNDSQTLTYLHGCISTKRHPISAPETPMYLDALLADEELQAGTRLKLGERALEVLTIKGYPGSTVPGVLEGLNQLAIPYRATTRFICLSKAQALAELERAQRSWFAQRDGLLSIVTQMLGLGGSQLTNKDALNKAGEIGMGIEVLQDDKVAFGFLTQVVVVEGATRQEAQERIEQVAKVIQGRGFATVIETLHSEHAWFSTHPGNVWAHVRRPLMHTLNLAHMLPLAAVWAGAARQTHLNGAPHLWTKTAGNTPFRLSTNVGDVGHTLVLGPTGAGKSVLLNLLGLQWLKYKGSRVVVFDKGASSLAACLGTGGVFHDPGKRALALQPLARVDDPDERTVAAQWIEGILVAAGLTINPRMRAQVWEALGQVANVPVDKRTLTAFDRYLQSSELHEALAPYVNTGSYASLFGSKQEDFERARWMTFEMESLLSNQRGAVPAFLSYLFHRLESMFDGSPTLLILDEAWVYLDNPLFAARIREWLKVLRKKNVYVIFASQSLADAMESPLAPTLLEACQTRLYLPNAQAAAAQIRGYYERLGLNARQIQIIASAQPKRDYYYQSKLGNRLFELGLGPVQLAFCASAAPEDLAALRRIEASVERGKRGQAWLEHKGLHQALRLVQSVQSAHNAHNAHNTGTHHA